MPLRPGAPVGDTIRELVHHGSRPRPMKQIIAIAEANHRRRADGGGLGADYQALVGGQAMPSQLMQMGNPQMSQQHNSLAAMPTERLRELALRTRGTPQGQIVQRTLMSRQMGMNQPPPANPAPAVPAGPMMQPQAAKRGGGIAHRAFGGSNGISIGEGSPWWERAEERNSDSSFLGGSTLGRGDHVMSTAPAGSYVLPADVVAGLGEGNSLAGARVWDQILHSLPYGIEGSGMSGRLPRASARSREGFARGGHSKGIGAPIPVALSHGEILVSPDDVKRLGRGDHKSGWKVLDHFVKTARARHINELKKLAPPVGSKA